MQKILLSKTGSGFVQDSFGPEQLILVQDWFGCCTVPAGLLLQQVLGSGFAESNLFIDGCVLKLIPYNGVFSHLHIRSGLQNTCRQSSLQSKNATFLDPSLQLTNCPPGATKHLCRTRTKSVNV